MFRGGPIRTKEVVAEVVVAAGVTPAAVEPEAAAEEVDPTRMVETSIMTILQDTIQGISITIEEGVEEVVDHLTTIMARWFKAATPLPVLGLDHDDVQ